MMYIGGRPVVSRSAAQFASTTLRHSPMQVVACSSMHRPPSARRVQRRAIDMARNEQTSSNSMPWRLSKPMILRIQDPGPNPQKVGILMEELRIPFNVEIIHEDSQKTDEKVSSGAPPVEDKNTGMIILEDPNTNTSLWESLAIVEFLVQTYDHKEELHYTPNTQDWWMCQQWLAYQMGAHSPFFSLKAWFSNQHEEKVPSVISRFSDDVLRIASILEHYLQKHGSGYLVGTKCTFADLVFVPWNNRLVEVMGSVETEALLQKYPHFRHWQERLMERPAVQRIMQNTAISGQ